MRIRPTIIVALLLLATTSGCRAEEKTFSKSFSVDPGGSLVLDTDRGSVTVEGTGGSEVRIEALLKGSGREIAEFQITADKRGEVIDVKGQWTSDGRLWSSRDLKVSYVVHVPQKFNVSVGTAGGSVTLRTLEGSVTGETSGGSVTAEDITGPLLCETSGGSITAERVTGKATLETSGGRVTAREVRGDVVAESSGGGLTLSGIDGTVHAETSGGGISIEVVGENRGIHAETSGGSIDITLPADARGTLDASTSGGSVRSDIPVTVQGEHDPTSLRGTINGGGPPIHASTSGGSIRIGPR